MEFDWRAVLEIIVGVVLYLCPAPNKKDKDNE